MPSGDWSRGLPFCEAALQRLSVTFDRGDLNHTFRIRYLEAPHICALCRSRHPYIGGSQGKMATRHISNARFLISVKPNVRVGVGVVLSVVEGPTLLTVARDFSQRGCLARAKSYIRANRKTAKV
jgi:hypothetical protein